MKTLKEYFQFCEAESHVPEIWENDVRCLLYIIDTKYGIKRNTDRFSLLKLKYYILFNRDVIFITKYVFRSIFMDTKNYLYNLVRRPNVSLYQVKSKFGELVFIYDTIIEVPEVDELIERCNKNLIR